MYFVLLVFVLCVFVLCFWCLDIYQLYFNCKFVRLSHSFIKGYLTWLDSHKPPPAVSELSCTYCG